MGELVCVGETVKGLFTMEKFPYEQKKRKLLSEMNERTDRLVNGIVYCRKCNFPKMADFPERQYVVKCACKCEVARWERERELLRHPPKVKEYRQGDWNPFD